MKCSPTISKEAGQALQNYYVADRKEVNESKKSKRKNVIPVTVRQLEAIIRLSEAIAKMSLSTHVVEKHVFEAHRLFQLSTLSAASVGFSSTTNIPQELVPMILRVEEAVRRRLAIGAKMPYTKLVEELYQRYDNSKAIEHVSLFLIGLGYY